MKKSRKKVWSANTRGFLRQHSSHLFTVQLSFRNPSGVFFLLNYWMNFGPRDDFTGKDTIIREMYNFYKFRSNRPIPPSKLSTDLEYSNNLYIYPTSVVFERYRNIVVRIQVFFWLRLGSQNSYLFFWCVCVCVVFANFSIQVFWLAQMHIGYFSIQVFWLVQILIGSIQVLKIPYHFFWGVCCL